MNSAQLKRRDALLARNDAALDRWPDRAGPAFIAEMSAVAEGSEALTQALARGGKFEELFTSVSAPSMWSSVIDQASFVLPK